MYAVTRVPNIVKRGYIANVTPKAIVYIYKAVLYVDVQSCVTQRCTKLLPVGCALITPAALGCHLYQPRYHSSCTKRLEEPLVGHFHWQQLDWPHVL